MSLRARAVEAAADRWMVQLEIDPTQTTSNTLQKPNNSTGTRFDVVPFQQSGTEIATSSVRYDGVTFQSGQPLTVLYQFNTYRFTYDLPVFQSVRPTDWAFRLGGTLAIRDAQTRLSQRGTRANYINNGPVPLLYASAVWSMTPHSALFVGVRYEVGGAEDDSIYTCLHQRSALAGFRVTF